MDDIITFTQTAVSVAAADLSALWSYLKLIVVPRLTSVNGLAFNPSGESFHFTFTIPHHSSVHSVKRLFFDLHCKWAGFQYIREIGDIEIWRVPRIKGGNIPGLDGMLKEIFEMRTPTGERYLEAFTELVLEGVRLEDDEIIEEEEEAVVEVMLIVPGRGLYDLFYEFRPTWLHEAHSVEELDELTAHEYFHFNLRALKNSLHLILKTKSPTRVHLTIAHLNAADKQHFRTLLVRYPDPNISGCRNIILKLPLSGPSKSLLECNLTALRFVARYACSRAPKIYGYALSDNNPLGTAYALFEGLLGTELQTALLHLPLPEQVIGSLYQDGPRKWHIGPIVQKSLLEPPGTWAGLGLYAGECGPWTSVEDYYISVLTTFTRWSKKSRKIYDLTECSEDIEALLQLLPVLLEKIDRRFWKLTLCFPYQENCEGFVVVRPLFHNSVFDLPDDALEDIIGEHQLLVGARINPYCILFRRLLGHLEADCAPSERVKRLGLDLTVLQREWESWHFGVENFG